MITCSLSPDFYPAVVQYCTVSSLSLFLPWHKVESRQPSADSQDSSQRAADTACIVSLEFDWTCKGSILSFARLSLDAGGVFSFSAVTQHQAVRISLDANIIASPLWYLSPSSKEEVIIVHVVPCSRAELQVQLFRHHLPFLASCFSPGPFDRLSNVQVCNNQHTDCRASKLSQDLHRV